MCVSTDKTSLVLVSFVRLIIWSFILWKFIQYFDFENNFILGMYVCLGFMILCNFIYLSICIFKEPIYGRDQVNDNVKGLSDKLFADSIKKIDYKNA